jgi:N-methylhydantoinase A
MSEPARKKQSAFSTPETPSVERPIGIRIGVDVGGTFTDVVAIDGEGAVFYTKTPSTPENQSIGVVTGIRKILDELQKETADVTQIVHGTTVATNALLERKGAKTALLTTAGFRDVLHIGRQDRPRLYDLTASRIEPLVPRQFRREAKERMLHTGEVLDPLDTEHLRATVETLLEQGVQSLAICFLHSYANPAHEQQALAEVRRLAPDLNVSVSSEILPEFREFERTSTTVINAYVQQAMERYLNRLRTQLLDTNIHVPLMVMQSNGGMMSTEAASARAINTLLSGPAGGVLAAKFLSDLLGGRNFITADVGGTSFDVALVEDGTPVLRTEGTIEGYPVKFPHIDIHTIGAGGGSIAWIDAGGGLRVGPRSAGAVPGPVCYRRGGQEPTVCDAFAVLGWLGANSLLNGQMQLDVEAARRAIADKIATPLNLTLEAAAEGIIRVANAAMCRAIRVLTVERGQDPRRFSLLPYGGSGPLHCGEIARELGIAEVLVPIAPGNFSAFGVLAAPIQCDEVVSYRATQANLDFPRLNQSFDTIERRAADRLRAEGCAPDSICCERKADMRYLGQAFELTVPVPAGVVGTATWRSAVEAFNATHKKIYGFSRPENPVEVVNLRITGTSAVSRPKLKAGMPDDGARPVGRTEREVFFRGRAVTTPVRHRDTLRPGDEIEGPAIVEEKGSTFVMAPRDRLRVDAWGNMVVSIDLNKSV